MSLRNKKKEGPKHQNKSKFALRDDSKMTRRVLKTPLDLLCQRCYDQIKWKMEYKKYKPLSQPGKCVDCSNRSVLKAYRALCDICARKPIDIFVPKVAAQNLGIIAPEAEEPTEENKETATPEAATTEAATEETKEVAEQVIPEASHEEEEKQADQATEEILAALAEETKVGSAAAAQQAEGSDQEEGSDDGTDSEEEQAKPAVVIPTAAVINARDNHVTKASRCSKCTKPVTRYATRVKTRQQEEQEREDEDDKIRAIVDLLKERQKRKIMRQLQSGEIDYDAKNDRLVYADTKEEFVVDEDSDEDAAADV